MRRIFRICSIIITSLVIFSAFVTLYGVVSYVKNAPKIRPFENLVFEKGDVITADSLAMLKSVKEYQLEAQWEDAEQWGGFTVSEDKQSITITKEDGYITSSADKLSTATDEGGTLIIRIHAVGDVSEHRSVEIPVTIK